MRSGLLGVGLAAVAAGGCYVANKTVGCTVDADCGSGLACVEGKCAFVCTRDEDCPAGLVCSADRACAEPAGGDGDPVRAAPEPTVTGVNLDTDCQLTVSGGVTFETSLLPASTFASAAASVDNTAWCTGTLAAGETGIVCQSIEVAGTGFFEWSVTDSEGLTGSVVEPVVVEAVTEAPLMGAPVAGLGEGMQPLDPAQVVECGVSCDSESARASIAAGSDQSCIALADGRTVCWGHNDLGVVGDGTGGMANEFRPNPTLVCVTGTGPGCAGGSPLAGVVAMTGGGSQTCALLGGGGVKCWGHASDGSVGDGTTGDSDMLRVRPVDVCESGAGSDCAGGSPLVGATAIDAGGYHTCAVTSDGGVKCWGGGNLGNGVPDPSLNPVVVCRTGVGDGCSGGASLGGIRAVSAGFGFTCALTLANRVFCWGDNSQGQLGDGTQELRLNPVAVCQTGSGEGCAGGAPLENVVALSAGERHVCVVRVGGEVWCWGSSSQGLLGDGSTHGDPVANPVRVCASGQGVGCAGGAALADVVAVNAGEMHTCALVGSGSVWCWGYHGQGAIGDGLPTSDAVRLNPVQVCLSGSGFSCLSGQPLLGVVALAAGGGHTCALTQAAELYCWGDNYGGQIGDGETGSANNRVNPIQVCASGSGQGCPSLGDIRLGRCSWLELAD